MSGIVIHHTIEDLLHKIEKYLCDVLSKEKLSHNAEVQRKHLVEQIEVAKLPPSLPPRNEVFDGASYIEVNDCLTILTELFKKLDNITNEKPRLKAGLTTKAPDLSGICDAVDGDNGDFYEDLDKGGGNHEPEDFYEEPATLGNQRKDVPEASDSGTDYDSYDEDVSEQRRGSVPLPTKKDISKKSDLPLSKLSSVLHMGELFQKPSGIFSMGNSLSRNFCALCDGTLYVYKSKEDNRPVAQVPLVGCEVTFTEKDGRFMNVLKLIQGGVEKHWFSASSKQNAGIWLQYLRSVCAGSGPPDIVEVEYLDLDEGLGSSLQQSSSSDTTVPSSTEGSGDGVVTSTGPQLSVTPDKTSSKPGGGGGLLKKIKKATIGKSSKTVTQLKNMDGKEAYDSDPDVKISGYAKVKCLTLIGDKKWHEFFCGVRNRTVECYKNLENPSPDICFALNGVTIEPAGLAKHELAIKLVQADKIFIMELLQPATQIEHGNWVSVLVKESGCGSPMAKLFPNSEMGEDIYDEVTEFSQRTLSEVPAHGGQNGSSKGTPPPLPRNPPPIRTPPDIKRPFEGTVALEDSDDDEDDADDNAEGGLFYEPLTHDASQHNPEPENINDSYVLSNLMTEGHARTTDANTEYMRMGFETPLDSKQEKKQVGELIGRLKQNLHKESSYPKLRPEPEKTETKTSGVIPCATGPTIAEDKELLDKTSNALLSEIRKSKIRFTKEELDKVAGQISVIQKEILNLKEKRMKIRSKKLETRKATEKENLQKELQDVDTELEEKQKEITKLQLVAQEQSTSMKRNNKPGTRGSNKNSPTVSRNSSFSSGNASPADSPRNSFKIKNSHAATEKCKSDRQTQERRGFKTTKFSALPTITTTLKRPGETQNLTLSTFNRGAEKKSTTAVKSSYSSKSEKSPLAGSKFTVKNAPGDTTKGSQHAEVKDSRTKTGLSKNQRSGSSPSVVGKTTSLDNIPKVRDRMKMFES